MSLRSNKIGQAVMKHSVMAIAALLGLLSASFALADSTLPQHAAEKHMGVATCASSFCHGNVQAKTEYSVMQNEYTVWSKEDAHSQAYNVLLNNDSQRIARKLGLPNAHEAAICLDCHADNVSSELQGADFQMTDGVGCEACHGGAENWLSSHVDGKPEHTANLAKGMYPTSNIEERGKLCLSCHLGNDNKFATHQIMGAGHPRLSFELSTFDALQPRHYTVDDDYASRKTAQSDARLWLIGQLTAANQTVANIEQRLVNKAGLFPEIALLDCHSCHHDMDQQQWAPTDSHPNLPAGSLRLNDSQFILVRPIMIHYHAAEAHDYLNNIRQLHQASTKSSKAVGRELAQLKAQITSLQTTVAADELAASSLNKILKLLVTGGAKGQYRDYTTAEHASMGIQVMAAETGLLTDIETELDRLFAVLDKENKYRPQQAQQAFRSLANKIQRIAP